MSISTWHPPFVQRAGFPTALLDPSHWGADSLFMSLTRRVPGQDFAVHRQGHSIREEIGVRLVLREYPACAGETPSTCLRIEIFDVPAHLIGRDGQLRFREGGVARATRALLCTALRLNGETPDLHDMWFYGYEGCWEAGENGTWFLEVSLEGDILGHLLDHAQASLDLINAPDTEFYRLPSC